ncbi:MAG: glycosyltransferase [Elusimicrobiota bacterium]
MDFLIAGLTVWISVLIAGLYASVLATWIYFRLAPRPSLDGGLLPITVIKPVRGLDAAMIPGLEALLRSDPKKRTQILIAMEDDRDPAWGPAKSFAAVHSDRDIEIVITGPAKDRMGKIHNMTQALPRAKHPYLVFSDADTVASPNLLAWTSAAFREGYDAIYALPYHLETRGLNGCLMQIAFSHGFSLPAALGYYLNRFHFYAGAWMGYTKKRIEAIGGLDPFSNLIADDYAIGAAASKSGSRKYLLPARIGVQEGDQTLAEALTHLAKWSAIIHSCLPWAYSILPLLDGVFLSLVAALLGAFSRASPEPGLLLLSLAAGSRAGAGLLQDLAFGEGLMPWYAYAGIPAMDLLNVGLWFFGFRSIIDWRGTRYRLSRGGRAEVLKET